MAETNQTAESVDPLSLALADIPPLTCYTAVADDERIEALRLIADSVAQQRQDAAKAIIFHPAILGVAVVVLAVVHRLLYTTRCDLALIGTTWAGCVMAGLVAVRGATAGYLELAEKTGTWAWLQKGRQQHEDEEEGEDMILVTKYGTEIIGALVLRAEGDPNSCRDPAAAAASPTMLGVIRAWTVKRRFRRKGIGAGLLEEAVSICRTRYWDGPVFADSHANSGRLLPRMFNASVNGMERRARVALDKVANKQRGRKEENQK